MIQIALFAIAGMMLAVFVGNMRREIGIWIALVTGVIVFFYAIRKFEYMVDMFRTMTEYTGIKEEYIAVVLKMIGIAFPNLRRHSARMPGSMRLPARLISLGK